MNDVEYLTEDQAAKILGVDKVQLQRLCRYGKVAHFKVARRTRVFLESDLHLGHSDLRMTARYAHLGNKQLDEAVELISGRYKGRVN